MNYFDRKVIAHIDLRTNVRMVIEGLRMAFTVEKFPPGRATRLALIYGICQKNHAIRFLRTGSPLRFGRYQEYAGAQMIFKGDITFTQPGKHRGGKGRGPEASVRRDGPDIITHIGGGGRG